jgi:hypothetical protein
MMALTNEDKSRMREEQKRMRAAQKKIEAAKAKDPKIRVVFTNVESPSKPGEPAPELNCTIDGEKYILEDGKEYVLPMSVVNHINGLTIPIYGYKLDEATGFVCPDDRPIGWKNRFSCHPVTQDLAQFAIQPEK